MPPSAHTASAAARFAPAGRGASGRARGERGRVGAAGVRWDRLGRVAMLGLLVALLYLYLSAGIRMFSTWSEAHRNSAAVASLQREHEALVRAHASLARQATVEAQARKLGMVRPGEQPYIISGLPGH